MSNTRAWTPSSAPRYLLAALVWLLVPAPGVAQGEGDVAAAWAGGALGGLSGLTLGLVGGAPPCSLSFQGARCARVLAAVGGVIGSAGGSVLAYHDADALRGRLVGAGLGAAAGAALGLGARAVVRQMELRDLATVAMVGAALGAVPVGAAVGLGAGLLAGSALRLTMDDHGLPQTLAMGVVGMALGGLMEWAYTAVDEADGAPPLVAQLSLRF
ncbi:MAG TPA: hypothetical protein VMM35_06585 [Longimicrobiales bacterium]|nr:hypothetical protein [Longimicrobiales bacterium]